jgi:hypothetical protein
MLIVKTIEEAKAAAQGFNVVYFNLQKKESASEIHEGHNLSLAYGKQFGNKVMVGFWYSQAVLNHVDSRWLPEPNLVWDKDGCLAWAESQNVDIAFCPELEDEINVYNISNFNYYRDLVNRIWTKENYATSFTNDISSDKSKIVCLGRLISNTGWKHIYSWKDGITRYIEMDFMNKHTNSRVIMAAPVKAPDGLYYSSSYFKYTAEEKVELAKIEPAILGSNLSGGDPVGVVADAIRAAVTDTSFVLQGANVTSDERFLGPGKKLVDLKFSIGTGENLKYDHYAFLIE